MIVGDLFSGIGGFSLAAEWMGWRTAWFSEIDPFACRVLAHHWPDVPNLGDITRIDWNNVERVDVLTGGFPCQPHSLAGKRLASSDERDLFSEIIRAVRVLRPRYIVLENVRGLLTSESGGFFGRVLGELAGCGYDVEWQVLSAADVGAPHRRERVWIVAYANRQVGSAVSGIANARPDRWHDTERRSARVGDTEGTHGWRELEARGTRSGRARLTGASESLEHTARGGRRTGAAIAVQRVNGGCEGLGDADDTRPQGLGRSVGIIDAEGRHAERRYSAQASAVVGWSDAVPVRGADGTVRLIPREAAEGGPESALWPVAARLPGRVARLRGIGNSIVPRCAYEIFQAIEARAVMEAA